MTDNKEKIVVIMPSPKAKFGLWSVAPNSRIVIEPGIDRFGKTRTGLTPEDATRLEAAMKMEEGMLSPSSKFWKTFKLVLTSKPEYLDLNEPANELLYLFAKNACWQVADSKEKLTPKHQFFMYNEVEEARVENDKFDTQLTAYKYLADMSQDERSDFLKLFGFRANSMSPMVIKKKLREKAEENSKLFVSLYEDKSKAFRILLEDLVQSKILKVKNGAYYFGEDMLGADTDLTIATLKNPKKQDLLLVLKKQLEDINK